MSFKGRWLREKEERVVGKYKAVNLDDCRDRGTFPRKGVWERDSFKGGRSESFLEAEDYIHAVSLMLAPWVS